jgi:hypothetical protein
LLRFASVVRTPFRASRRLIMKASYFLLAVLVCGCGVGGSQQTNQAPTATQASQKSDPEITEPGQVAREGDLSITAIAAQENPDLKWADERGRPLRHYQLFGVAIRLRATNRSQNQIIYYPQWGTDPVPAPRMKDNFGNFYRLVADPNDINQIPELDPQFKPGTTSEHWVAFESPLPQATDVYLLFPTPDATSDSPKYFTFHVPVTVFRKPGSR